MKVIDKTPLQNEKGEIGVLERLQGTLKYGFSWYPELEAQKQIVAQLDRALEKGFVLIRNLTLPGSEIVEPLILIGPPGVYIIYVSHLTGFYEAKGDQWNTINNGRSQPAPINLMSRVARLARAMQVYLQRQGIDLPSPVEPVLIAANPGMHIDSLRPVVRVVLSDAVKQFSASLIQSRPLLRPEFVYDLSDRIVEPRSKASPQQAPVAAPVPASSTPQTDSVSTSQSPSRAQAIFHATEQAQPFNPSDLSFAFDESASQPAGGVPENLREPNPSQPVPQKNAAAGGLSMSQFAVLGVMALVECCVLVGFAYLIFSNR